MNEQLSAECDPWVSTSTFRAWRSKITEEPLEDQESENTETWQKLHGHAIVAGERLQEKINESVSCLFSHGNVELVEKLQTWFHLDVPVNFSPSHETNLAFPTTEKSRAFAINRASVLGFRTIGGSHDSLKGF